MVSSLFFGSIVTYIMVYFSLFRGSNSLGKVVYVTVTLPYIILAILLIMGITREGAWSGISYMMLPKFTGEKAFYRILTNFKVWERAFV